MIQIVWVLFLLTLSANCNAFYPPDLSDRPHFMPRPVIVSGGGGGSLSVVQSTGHTSGTSSPSSIQIPFQSNVTAGNAIGVCIGEYLVGGTFNNGQVTDSQANTYTLLAENTANIFKTACWIARNVAGGATTITFTPSAAAPMAFGAIEINGAATSGTSEATASDSGNSTTPTSSNLVTSVETVIYSALTHDGANPTTLGAGGTYSVSYEEEENEAASAIIMIHGVKSAGTNNSQFTMSPARNYAMTSVAIK